MAEETDLRASLVSSGVAASLLLLCLSVRYCPIV